MHDASRTNHSARRRISRSRVVTQVNAVNSGNLVERVHISGDDRIGRKAIRVSCDEKFELCKQFDVEQLHKSGRKFRSTSATLYTY